MAPAQYIKEFLGVMINEVLRGLKNQNYGYPAREITIMQVGRANEWIVVAHKRALTEESKSNIYYGEENVALFTALPIIVNNNFVGIKFLINTKQPKRNETSAALRKAVEQLRGKYKIEIA